MNQTNRKQKLKIMETVILTEQVTQNINSILDEKGKSWEEKHEYLKVKLDSQEKRLHFLEKQSRQININLFGLEETESSYSNFENTLINFINKYFKVKVDQRDIHESGIEE